VCKKADMAFYSTNKYQLVSFYSEAPVRFACKIPKRRGLSMKKHKDKCPGKCGPDIYNRVDSHKWENKMEIHHLTSGKADIKVVAKLPKDHNCTN
jgi:hypothetical protein